MIRTDMPPQNLTLAPLQVCPFHEEATPSFYVNNLTNSYYCFGCGAKGKTEELNQDLAKFVKPQRVNLMNMCDELLSSLLFNEKDVNFKCTEGYIYFSHLLPPIVADEYVVKIDLKDK